MSRRVRRWFQAYLTAWVLGTCGAAVSHIAAHEREAAASHFPHSAGWQREIGFFNLAVAALLVQILRRGDDTAKRGAARVGVLLSILLGAHHVAALTEGGPGSSRIHWTALVLNVLNGSTAAVLLGASRQAERASPAV